MPTIIRRNERSWAISMITDINIRLQTLGLRIVRAGGETTISTGHQSMFPDVLLYGDDNQTQILQGWELKLPDTLITDIAFISDAQRKATSLGLNSCFIWNFTAGVLYVRNEEGSFEVAKQWNETSHIQTRDDVERYKHEWLPVIEHILFEINGYLLTGEIHGSELGEILSDTIVVRIIERNKAIVSDELRRVSTQNARIGAYLSVWWNEAQSDYAADETDMYSAYAKTMLLNWTNRIIFAHLIKSRYNAAMAVETLNFDTSVTDSNRIFDQITEACDFFSIFNGVEQNAYLPNESWHDLMDLNIFLTDNGVHQIDQGALQNVLEQTVAVAKRELNGQFTTPAVLADLLVRLTTHDLTGDAIDPCCGTGSIPQALLKRKKELLGNVAQAVSTTWAADKFSFPLQLANISMTDTDAINLPSQVFQNNVFSLQEGNEILITNPANGERIALRIPLYTTIVSNLPFIPFEKISSEDQIYIQNLCNEIKRNTHITLSNRSDYYSYILFALHSVLVSGGFIGVITSNSWLGTSAGREFYRALGYYYKIEQVHISGSGRWFSNAQVVTVITILSKRDVVGQPANGEITAFCTWQKSLSGLTDNENARDIIVNSSLLGREIDARIFKYKPYSYEDISALFSMNISLSSLFHDVHWLLGIRDKLTPISTVFNVVRGERRGWDTMFYPAAGHGIEQRYIRRVLKNARAVNTLYAQTDSDAFCCSSSLTVLRNEGHEGALSWIARFENGVNQTGKPLTEVLSRANMHWYEMSDNSTADIITTMNPDRRLFYAKFDEPTFINQRLIGLKRKDRFDDLELYHALLNSILGMFYIEAVGFGRGLGALDISSTTIRNALMLNPSLISAEQRRTILTRFEPLLNRNVLSTEEELAQEDRGDFDLAVLNAYGIAHHYNEIKNSLLSMQHMRLCVRQ